MGGPRPKRRGPNKGESVGGVCPDEALWAVMRERKFRTVTMTSCKGWERPSKNVAKWAGG